MKYSLNESRRHLLKRIALGVVLVPVATTCMRVARADELQPLSADDPTAKALKYVDNASKASDAKPGSKCSNCTLYQGAAGSAQGGCQIFPGKAVKAGGWCSSWTAKT
jgi:hypothetical protein